MGAAVAAWRARRRRRDQGAGATEGGPVPRTGACGGGRHAEGGSGGRPLPRAAPAPRAAPRGGPTMDFLLVPRRSRRGHLCAVEVRERATVATMATIGWSWGGGGGGRWCGRRASGGAAEPARAAPLALFPVLLYPRVGVVLLLFSPGGVPPSNGSCPVWSGQPMLYTIPSERTGRDDAAAAGREGGRRCRVVASRHRLARPAGQHHVECATAGTPPTRGRDAVSWWPPSPSPRPATAGRRPTPTTRQKTRATKKGRVRPPPLAFPAACSAPRTPPPPPSRLRKKKYTPR